MTLLVGLISFFIILGLLIVVHELGHFTVAKLNGVRVDEFGLGFPPRVASVRRGETVYSLNAIPLGGFVKMLGENGEADDPDSFGSKAPWRRLLILLSGPSMNLLLALTIFFFVFMKGSPQGITTITAISPHSPAAAAGLRPGDTILAIDGKPVTYLEDLHNETVKHVGDPVSLAVRRGTQVFGLSLVPRVHPPANQGAMGVVMDRTVNVAYTPGAALRLSLGAVGAMVTTIPVVLQNLFAHGGSQVQGPIGIAHDTTSVVGSAPSNGPGTVLQFIALLSANLGVVNLLPIPALDGGRIVFVLLSWVRRRNLDPEVEGIIHMVGMALLLCLILFVSYHDLARWIGGGSF